MICSVTSEKFPGQEAYFASTVMPLATTLYKIGIFLLEQKMILIKVFRRNSAEN